MIGRFYILTFLIYFFSGITLLSAQKFDTIFYDSGEYAIYTRNENGNIEGTVSYYDENHTLKKTIEYNNGTVDGISIVYSEEGKQLRRVPYKNGVLHGKDISYHPNGKIELIMPYKKGLMHGKSISYHSNGNIEWIRPHKNDKMDGQRIVRDSTGNLVNRKYTTLHESSKVKYTVNCEKGVPYGKFEMIRFDSTISFRGNFENGYPDGIFTYYDSEGNIESEDLYRMGKYISGVSYNKQNDADSLNKILGLMDKSWCLKSLQK